MGELAEHIVNHPYLTAGLVALLVAVIVFEVRTRSTGRIQVAPADAVRLINNGAVVVDVRSAEQYGQGHIVSSRNVELGQLGPEHPVLKKQKSKILIAVCDNGMNSGKAAARLRDAGFENAFSLKGGLNAWRAENLPVVK